MTSCLLPAWFASVAGLGPPVVHYAPTDAAPMSVTAPPSTGKAYPLAPAGYRHDTPNFTVQWDDPTIPESIAARVGTNAEEAWSVFVEDDGWMPPPTSDDFRILVYLTAELEAAGLATFTPEGGFDDGLPIIYINPDYVEYAEYFESVIHHEFSHTLQFALRDWYGAGPEEWWYWEASSTWMQTHVRPMATEFTWISSFYADSTTATFETVDGGHEYAMYLLNAYLEDLAVSRAGFQSIWMDSTNQPWLAEIERVTEEPAATTWAKFSGAYVGRRLRHAEYLEYPPTETAPGLIEGHLGAQYLRLGPIDGVLMLDEGVGTVVRDETASVFTGSIDIPDGSGEVTLVVTNPSPDPLSVSFSVSGPLDTGEPDTGTLGPGLVDSGPVGDGSISGAKGESRSGCATAAAPAWCGWLALLVLLRRRFGSQRECPPR